jgi:hypothetical protein
MACQRTPLKISSLFCRYVDPASNIDASEQSVPSPPPHRLASDVHVFGESILRKQLSGCQGLIAHV